MKGIVGKLTQGAADAGFVYVTDVNAAGDALKAIELPADLEPDVTYGAGVVEGREAARPGAARSSTGLTSGPCADALEDAGFGAGAVSGAPSRSLLALALAARADLPDAADRRDLRRLEPRRADRQPRRAGRARRALAEPAHHGDLARDHPGRRHARRVPARHPLVPRQGARDHADRAAARAAAGRGRHRAARGRRAVRASSAATIEAAGIELSLETAGVVVALTFVASPVLRAPGDRGLRSGGPHAARRLAHARRLRGARLRARDDPRARLPGLAAGTRARARAARSASSARR